MHIAELYACESWVCKAVLDGGEQDNCDKLPSILGEYRCQVKSHKTIYVERTNWEAPGMKISDRLSVSADICLHISDYRNIGKNPYRCNTTDGNKLMVSYNYHRSTKLYHKISRVCCCLYCSCLSKTNGSIVWYLSIRGKVLTAILSHV